MPPVRHLAELVEAATGGSDSAWDELVQRYVGLVWSVPRGSGLGPSASSDVVQTTWLRLAERLAELGGADVGPWVAAAARQESVRALRWVVDHEDDGPLPSAAGAAVLALPARLRFALRVLCAEPPPDDPALAAALAVPVSATVPLVAQAVARLREVSDDLAELDDPAVLERLRSSLADPVPAAVHASARSAYSWRTLEAELLPSARDSLDDELVSLRGSTDSRLLTYALGPYALELEVAVERGVRSVVGQVSPPDAVVRVLRPDGATTELGLDDLGRFLHDDLEPGPLALLVSAPPLSWRTEWVAV